MKNPISDFGAMMRDYDSSEFDESPQAELEGQLIVQEGEVVQIVYVREDGWALVRSYDGDEGYVPSEFYKKKFSSSASFKSKHSRSLPQATAAEEGVEKTESKEETLQQRLSTVIRAAPQQMVLLQELKMAQEAGKGQTSTRASFMLKSILAPLQAEATTSAKPEEPQPSQTNTSDQGTPIVPKEEPTATPVPETPRPFSRPKSTAQSGVMGLGQMTLLQELKLRQSVQFKTAPIIRPDAEGQASTA